MFRQIVCLLVVAAVAQGQDCDTDGIKLGEACTTNTDCNSGDCPIVHSKCDSGSCACALGYWGADATRMCDQVELGGSCTANETCSSSTPNSACSSGTCACGPGYYQATTRIAEKYCKPLSQHTPCVAGAAGDAFCAEGEVNGNMTCSSITGACACPDGYVFIPDTQECFLRSSDASCAMCVNSGGVCYNDGTADQCSCPTTKYSSTGNPISTGCDKGSAGIGEICQEDGSVTCADTNAECVHFGTMTKRFVCHCKTGFVSGPEWGNPGKLVCHEELSSRQDGNCDQCNINEGKCYDVDGDGVHDQCKCPTSRSTSDLDDYSTYCDTKHVNVTCDSDSMTVCYIPHDTREFPDIATALTNKESMIFIKDNIKDKNCHLMPSADGWCIDLVYNSFLSCGTLHNQLNEHTVSYTNWAILQRQPEKRTVNDMYIYTYCSYDSMVNAFTGHVAVEIGEPPAVAAEGDLVQAGVRLDILDQFGNDASRSGVILGQRVQLLANITDDKGVFREIKAEVCLASNLPDLSSPFARTTLMLYDGCPETNVMVEENLVFRQDLGNGKITRSNMFSMFKFDDSEYVFFHCALRVCMEGNTEECDPSSCARRKKRAITDLVKRNAIADQKKMAKAMKSFDSPDFQVSVSALKVKREVSGVQSVSGLDAPTELRPFISGGASAYAPSDEFSTQSMIMVGGGLFGLLLLVVLVVVIVVVLKRPAPVDRRAVDVEAQQPTSTKM